MPTFRSLNLSSRSLCENGIQAVILDFADGGLFLDVDVNDPALRRLLAFETQIVEVAGVPERVEIALQTRLVVDVAAASGHARLDGVGRNAPVSSRHDIGDDSLLRQRHCAQQQQDRRKPQEKAAPPNRRPTIPSHRTNVMSSENSKTSGTGTLERGIANYTRVQLGIKECCVRCPSKHRPAERSCGRQSPRNGAKGRDGKALGPIPRRRNAPNNGACPKIRCA